MCFCPGSKATSGVAALGGCELQLSMLRLSETQFSGNCFEFFDQRKLLAPFFRGLSGVEPVLFSVNNRCIQVREKWFGVSNNLGCGQCCVTF